MTDRQPGSYLIDADGNPQPNLEDSAMAERKKTAEEAQEADAQAARRKGKKEVVNNADQ